MAEPGEGAAGAERPGAAAAEPDRQAAAGGQPQQAVAARGRPQRPALVTWLCLGVITLAGVQVAGVLGALRLPELPLSVPRNYLILRSGLWALWGLGVAAGAFGRATWSAGLLRWGALALAGWYWLDQVLLAQSAYARLGTPSRAAVTLLLLGIVWWSLDRPSVRRYFEENHG